MLGHAIAHAESIRCCERSSPCGPISRPPAVGGARPTSGHAARTEAVAHRDERIARGGRATACNKTRSARQGGIPDRLRQPAHGQPRPLATRSRTPARVDHASAAVVAILVALCRRVQGLAKTDRPALRLSSKPSGLRMEMMPCVDRTAAHRRATLATLACSIRATLASRHFFSRAPLASRHCFSRALPDRSADDHAVEIDVHLSIDDRLA